MSGQAAGTSAPIVHLTQALADALTAATVASGADGALPNRAARAVYNRAEVARLSAAGTPVAQIATALSLSANHVVAIRALLGVGRRR